MHDLRLFVELYGQSDLLRILEIKAPKSVDVFIRRLYEEMEIIIRSLEGGRKERHDDSEDRLSIEIVNCLRSAGYYSEKDPTHGGHVDILVAPERNRSMKWYGEAKIWNGVTYLNGGIDQLLSRYASGRDRQLGFLVYFKEKNLISKMKTWLTHVDGMPDVYPNKSNVIDDYSFTSTHRHSTGATIEVRHFAINIDWDPI